MLLSAVMAFSLFPVSAGAAQVNSYHDPAENWMQASGRTNELDVNAVVTHETFNCGVCGKPTSFRAFRTPEYSKDGRTAMNRNVKYSDGTLLGGAGTGTILDGIPGQNATYTGYHWTKAVCDTCGTVNSNILIPSSCLNATVTGLLSRTFLRSDIIGPHDFHGAAYYDELAGEDLSGEFLEHMRSFRGS